MTVVRRITATVSVLLVLLLALAGIGLGVTLWLQSWHSDYLRAAQGTEAISNPALQGLLNGLSNRADIMTVVIIVVAVVALGVGVVATVLLGRMIGGQLRAAISKIGGSAAQLLAVASQVAASTAQTAAATNESTATVEEVKQTAVMAQEKTMEASELSQDLSQRCKFGTASSTQNFGTFTHIQDDLEAVAGAIDRLAEQTQSVGDIIMTVNDLAEQSNLLSVNASIEAAKAGDQGKGFTVVAQEVKNLAEQSKLAVVQVRAVLHDIQEASEAAVRSVEQSREAIEAGKVEAGRSIDNTKAEVEIADRAIETAMQISATSRQQLAGMEQISHAMLSINEAGSQAVQGTRQVEKEVRELQRLADSLEALVDASARKRARSTSQPVAV
jgi:methyl-accepting chemotaxis protein